MITLRALVTTGRSHFIERKAQVRTRSDAWFMEGYEKPHDSRAIIHSRRRATDRNVKHGSFVLFKKSKGRERDSHLFPMRRLTVRLWKHVLDTIRLFERRTKGIAHIRTKCTSRIRDEHLTLLGGLRGVNASSPERRMAGASNRGPNRCKRGVERMNSLRLDSARQSSWQLQFSLR